MQVEEINISELKENPANPRTISEEKFAKLVKSIKNFPEMLKIRPLVIDAENFVLGGNMRLKALQVIGCEKVLVIRCNALTEAQKKQFIITDNSSFGQYDWDMIANEGWLDLPLADWGLDLPDFVGLEASEDDYEIPEEIKTSIKPGDLFELSDGNLTHKLICGDSTKAEDVERLMDGKKADMLHCDPPYGVDYADKNEFLNKQDKGNRIQKAYSSDKEKDYEIWFKKWIDIVPLSDYNSIYIWINEPHLFDSMLSMKSVNMKLSSLLIWVKNNHVLSRKDYHPKYEICLFGWKGKHKFYGGFNTSILEYDKPLKNDLHPTMKPINLISQLINNSTEKGQLITELFLGSGTTMVAAHQLGRHCFGIEIEPKYCQIILDRMKKSFPEIEIKKIE